MKGIITSIGLCSYVRFLLAGGLMTFVLTSCTHAQTVDLSTDEAVRKELAKNSEFKSKLDRLCIERIKESAKIIVIGNHANDRGCRIDGAFVNSVYFDYEVEELSVLFFKSYYNMFIHFFKIGRAHV